MTCSGSSCNRLFACWFCTNLICFAPKGGTSGTRKSGHGLSKSPHDKSRGDRKHVCSLEMDLLDNDDNTVVDGNDKLTDTLECDLLDVHTMLFACILCSNKHDPYACLLLKGNVEEQRAVFANLHAQCQMAKVQ